MSTMRMGILSIINVIKDVFSVTLEEGDDKRNVGLDIIRAIAILMVLVCHLLDHVMADFIKEHEILKLLAAILGKHGVNLFFVLSGFLIGRIIINLFVKQDNDYNNLKLFYSRRWLRTLPVYYFVMLGFVAIGICNPGLSQTLTYNDVAIPSFANFVFLQNFFSKPFLWHSWSLAVEELFYLTFPLLLLLIKKINKKLLMNNFTLFIISIIVIECILRMICFTVFPGAIANKLFWGLNSFYMGILFVYLSMYHKKIFSYLSNNISFIISIFTFGSIILYYCYFKPRHSNWLDYILLDLVSFSFAVIISNLFNKKLKPLPFIQKLSKLSYSIYLIHLSVFGYVASISAPRVFYLVTNISKNFNIEISDQVIMLITHIINIPYCLIFTWIVAYFLYKFIEKPFMDLRDYKIQITGLRPKLIYINNAKST